MMSAPPPPPPGFGPPPGSGRPPGYGPPAPYGPPQPYGPPSGLGPPPGPTPPGYRAPHRKGNANGAIAAAVAALVIVAGVVSTVLLVTSDSNTAQRAGLGSASAAPSGAGASDGSARPTGSRAPIGTSSAAGPQSTQAQPAGDLTGATSAGTDYFDDLDANFYLSSQDKWCDPSAFPLTQADVDAVTSAGAAGPAAGGPSSATMSGHLTLDDGRSGTLTIFLRPVDNQGVLWCITSQSRLR